jgi:hypothetical protein
MRTFKRLALVFVAAVVGHLVGNPMLAYQVEDEMGR